MRARYRWPLIALGSLIVLLVALQLALPYLVRDYLNEKLADMGDYRGQVSDVDLAWWRGAYTVNGLKIVKTTGKVPVPFLNAPVIDISVSWHSLWYDRAVVAEVAFLRPELNFVDGGDKQNSQTGQGTDWRQQLDKLLPITLNEVVIDDGVLTFRNFSSKPPVTLKATQLQASIRNLTNIRDEAGRRDASFEARALVAGDAKVESRATFDPFSDFDDFEFRLRATGIELRRLNDFASAYGKFDFKAGHGDVVIEAEATNGRLNGYIKPLLRDVEVFDWQQDVEDKDKGLFRSVWEALVGATETVLKNQPKNQFATRVELSGSVRRQNISAFEAFLQILRNGFVQAFSARYERSAPDSD
ncbi:MULTISPECIES: DUF748 domain-containing protein [Pseudomonas]|uniref:DUF748 domain-containing protein n=1 Tax=Pseudomonas parafulva TaxID=157782 RepID=A0AAJ0LNM9_9PSED|nr:MULTISPECIES: DUF748 domain-containing protein [Pseudomonas]AQW69460.1 hypothetical protein B2J77_15120 [Pseudomonas parafulva]AUA34024.1 DUF748 domain-containing protein [Pseudomonas sp. SGAir0191]KTT18688.1 hypothetical protein NS96R_07325 [Pseudomonas parafulva]MBA5707876.1 DUF748 domain-containing protein [Pseudomonas fulva]MBF8638402.1 DUF748 domain-containing protein [Pseudomonas fulva]